MNHIGDVIEDALGWDRDIWSVPGWELAQFGDRVREWAHEVSLVTKPPAGAAYYGGWPSANLPTIGWDGVVSTSLLLENHVIGKDPISDWFCFERNTRPNLMASRAGWQPHGQSSSPDVAATRHFLAIQIPSIRRMLPLLDCGIVSLVPSEILESENRRAIDELVKCLSDNVLNDPLRLARQFQPDELTVDDDVRGSFVLTGGDAEEQTGKHLLRAVEYFSSEYVLSQAISAMYTSIFDWDTYLLQKGVHEAFSPVVPTAQLMLSSRIPAFSGLTPKIIRTIHDDDAFGDFRADLVSIYGDCPVATQPEVDAYVRDREKAVIEPRLAQISKELDRGPFSRLGIGASKISFSLVAGMALAGVGAITAGPLGALTGLIPPVASVLDAARKRTDGPVKIWTSLVKHGRTVQDEIPQSSRRAGIPGATTSTNPWGIDAEPGPHVVVAPGRILNWYAIREERPVAGDEFQEGKYAPCSCGSGLKYRFCCDGVTPAP